MSSLEAPWSSFRSSHGVPQRAAGSLAVIAIVAFGITACTTQLDGGLLSWTRAMPCFRHAASHSAPHHQPQAAAREPVPAVLAHILMMTAFHWITAHLSFLTQARLTCVMSSIMSKAALEFPCRWCSSMHRLRVAICVDSFVFQVHGSGQRHQYLSAVLGFGKLVRGHASRRMSWAQCHSKRRCFWAPSFTDDVPQHVSDLPGQGRVLLADEGATGFLGAAARRSGLLWWRRMHYTRSQSALTAHMWSGLPGKIALPCNMLASNRNQQPEPCCARPQVIKNVESYPTMTDFVISTNGPEQLENWRRTNTQGATAFRVHAAVDMHVSGAYGLTWAHRDVAEDSLVNGALFGGKSSVWSGRGLTSVQAVSVEADENS